MAIETIKTLVPRPVGMPRGALWAATAAAWPFGATWEAGIAAVATWPLRAIASLARRFEAWGSEEPRTPQELLALARSLERTQPNLAAELRFIALHRPEATERGSS
jgi:hypothetical protein